MITPLSLAESYIGVMERTEAGADHPFIQAWHWEARLGWDVRDEVP